ncbi:MAG: TonB-dependent receptor [Candidatus Competibacteraceae bacterium]|nr:TonB-dependent receptor [Candidatus Competibacteraceae bacterium]
MGNQPKFWLTSAGMFLLVVCTFALRAEEALVNLAANSDSQDEAWLGELMQVLDESTEIATKSRLNVDYVPGMVTVLQGRELETLGMRTVWDALALIPGVMLLQGRSGELFVGVRGFTSPFNSGNIKVLLNSSPMSRESSGLTSQALSLPIEQVDRIEFIRGPNALLYGDFAYYGVLNILTRQQTSQVTTRVDEHGTMTVSGLYADQSEDGVTRLSLNIAGVAGHSVEAPVGVNVKNDQQSAILKFAHRGFELTAQGINEDYAIDQGVSRDQHTETLIARQSLDLAHDAQLRFSLGYLNNDFEEGLEHFLGHAWEGRMELTWQGMERHQWLLQLSYTDDRTEQARRGLVPAPPDFRPRIIYDVNRRYYGISLQDQYEASDRLTLTAGLRFDHRDDLDQDFWSPRLAAVWQAAEGHIWKAQYASGYRAPTFWELFIPDFNSNLDTEKIGTSELSYIYHRANRTVRLTWFHSKIDDHINFIKLPPPHTFVNTGASEVTGMEFEWEQQWSPRFKSWFNLSYADSQSGLHPYLLGGEAIGENPSTADWLGNLALFYRPAEHVLLAAYWNYVGARHAESIDTDPEHRVALTLSLFDVWTQGLTLRFGVRNLLQVDQQFLVSEPGRVTSSDFPNSLVWGQISYDF